jgi:hypothetical protein
LGDKLIKLIFSLAIIDNFDYCTVHDGRDEQEAHVTSDPKSTSDWQDLLKIAQGGRLVVERVQIPERHITVEGAFTLPELARLTLEDQVFIIAFLRSHGSIKEMEQVFGVSYPTIKARLNRIAGQLEFVDTNPSPSRAEVLERLNKGEVSADEAIRALEALK